MPIITYAAEVYSSVDSHSMPKLQVTFNNVTRYVYGLKRFASISSWKRMILGIELEDFLRLRYITFLHKLSIKKSPNYLYNKHTFG